jgi:hypothetical protein
MTSQSDSTSDFLTIMKELRIHAHACIGSSSVGPYIPSVKVKAAYEKLRALPVSDSDVADDAQQQIKAVSYAGATNSADTLKASIEAALETFMSQYLTAPGVAKNSLKEKMDLSRITAKANVEATLDQAYDKAENLAEGTDAQIRAIILAIVEGEILDGLNEITSEIQGWMDYSANDLLALPDGLPEELATLYSKVAEAAYEVDKKEFLQELSDQIERRFG